jgi:hypothetical protein
MALTGTLGRPDKREPASIYGKNIVVPSMGQVVCFCVAVALTLVFGFKAM